MGGRLPDFLGVGVQKGGTTTLQLLLEQHPGVYVPEAKELHYFSLHYGRGEGWYREQLAAASPNQRCGEITPYYLFHPEAASRIHALVPAVRLIVLLRDPVERSLSQYFHSRRLGLEPLELEQALAAEQQRLEGSEAELAGVDGRHRSHQEHSYLARSRYELQLQRLERLFPAEQLLVLRSEDLFAQSEGLWQQVLTFLEVEAVPLPAGGVRGNGGGGEAVAVAQSLRDQLRQRLAPTYDWAASRYGMSWS